MVNHMVGRTIAYPKTMVQRFNNGIFGRAVGLIERTDATFDESGHC